MNPIGFEDITVVILAGGRGQRMGGQDKGLLPLKNMSMIEHVIDAVRSQSNNIVISANRNLESYTKFGYPVFSDDLSGFQGPLAGFLSAMSVVSTDYIISLPCDGPTIAEDYIERMINSLNQSGQELAIAADEERMQPVYALIPVALQPSLQQYLSEGGRKIIDWYKRHEYSLVKFTEDKSLFINLNTTEDWQNFNQPG